MTDEQKVEDKLSSPIPVAIEAPETLDVNIVDDTTGRNKTSPANRIQSQKHDPSVPAKTTFQDDLTTAGQRRVNLIWEYTQSIIALLVVIFTMGCGVYAMYSTKDIPSIISVAFGMVTGFYFSRTNHEKVGGPGTKRVSDYVGR